MDIDFANKFIFELKIFERIKTRQKQIFNIPRKNMLNSPMNLNPESKILRIFKTRYLEKRTRKAILNCQPVESIRTTITTNSRIPGWV